MSDKVCYITKDDVVENHSHKILPQYTYNVDPECVKNNAIRQMSGDSFTSKVPDGQVVVAINHYDNKAYQTQVETLKEGGYSQCDGPDSIRGVTSYYTITEEILVGICTVAHGEL